MGFVKQKKVYRLVFEDPDLNGLEVRTHSVPLGKFLEMSALADTIKKSTTEEAESQVRLLLSNFADSLVSWNLENEDGSPVPANIQGLNEQEFDFVISLINSWMEAIASVPGPLAQKSSDGGQSLEDLIPMEIL